MVTSSLIGNCLAIGTLKGKIYLISWYTCQILYSYQAHDSKITGISINQSQENSKNPIYSIASSSNDATLKILKYDP